MRRRSRFFDRFQPRCHRRPFVVAKIGIARTGRDHQLVVRDSAFADQHRPAGDVDAADRAEDHSGVRLPRENTADRSGDVGRRQGRGRDLVQQRLKQMMVAPIDERDPNRRPPERPRRTQAGETAADDDHVWRRLGVVADAHRSAPATKRRLEV